MVDVFIRVWEYEVPAEQSDAFLVAYGSGGDWVQLFRRGRGYVGTELYRGTDTADRFVTVDRWTDAAAWHAFLEEWGEAYNALDTRLAGLGAVERALKDASL